MRIHSDYHNRSTVLAALRHCKDAGLIHPSVNADVLTEHGSRKRRRGIEVQLGAHEGAPWFLPEPSREFLAEYGPKAQRAASVRRRRNGGSYGASGADLPMAATWHEWGYFLAALFHDDPAMSATYYANIGEFEARTAGALPTWAESGRAGDFLTAVEAVMPSSAVAA